jgi:uncharacterized protein (DUF362 family)
MGSKESTTMQTRLVTHRRAFLKSSLLGGMAAMAAPGLSAVAAAPAPAAAAKAPSRVALTAGDDRADNIFRGLRAFEKEIARAIGDRRVVIKPNNVSIDIQLSASHADSLGAILEFLKSIGKLDGAVIAESAGTGATWSGFENFGYLKVAEKYGVKLVDLDEEETRVVQVFDENDFRPHAVRMSKRLLDPGSFLISAAMLKTHDRVLATLSLKNIIFGAPVKDLGFRWDNKSKAGTKTDKPIAHGGGIHGINYNLFDLARRLHPHLSVIDGYAGMEGNGPCAGTPVDHRVAVVARDWLAADRVAVELMGIDFAKVGYLNFCADARLGEADLNRIEIVGEPIARHVRQYKLADNLEEQLSWTKAKA